MVQLKGAYSRNHMKNIFISLILTLAVTANILAADATPTPNYKQVLSSVSVLEMPAKAAELVKDAPAKTREIVTSAVVRNAAGLKPTALPAVVGAIAKSSPEMAATAAAVATSVQPKLAVDVSKAAAASAPSQAAAIVAAVCKVLPANYHNVAVVVAQIAPDAASGILAAVGSSIPKLQPFIQQASAGGTGAINVGSILTQAEILASGTPVASITPTAPAVRPPTINPPYNPLPPGTPGTGSVTNSGVVPPGGRDYEAP